MTSEEGGFTLPDVLFAVAIIGIGLMGLMVVVPVGSYGVQQGNQVSTAAFLIDQKLEQARAVPWTAIPANDCLGTSSPATAAPTVPAAATCAFGVTNVAAGGALPWFADEAAGSIAGFAGYSRRVRLTDCSGAPGCTGIIDPGMRRVTVSVTYQPMTGVGASPSPQTVTATLVIAQR